MAKKTSDPLAAEMQQAAAPEAFELIHHDDQTPRWLRTADGQWYVHELRGVCFVSWVAQQDRAHAACFPAYKADEWARLIGEMTGKALEVVTLG